MSSSTIENEINLCYRQDDMRYSNRQEPDAKDNIPLTSDGLLNHRLSILQPARGARFNMDSIMLAAAVEAQKNDRVLELGMGVGAVSLALAWRMNNHLKIVGIEKQKDLFDCAKKNIERNDMTKQCEAREGDIFSMPSSLYREHFDHIITNPPWRDPHHEQPSTHAGRRQAFHQGDVSLEDWMKVAINLTSPHATLTLICGAYHRALLLQILEEHYFRVHLRPLLAKQDANAMRLIIKAHRHGSFELTEHTPLVLHEADGKSTQAAEHILRHGKALSWDE